MPNLMTFFLLSYIVLLWHYPRIIYLISFYYKIYYELEPHPSRYVRLCLQYLVLQL